MKKIKTCNICKSPVHKRYIKCENNHILHYYHVLNENNLKNSLLYLINNNYPYAINNMYMLTKINIYKDNINKLLYNDKKLPKHLCEICRGKN